MEKIVSIEEDSFVTENKGYKSTYDGYLIQTSEQLIKIGISDFQSCCESFGYLSSEDDLTQFVGAEFLGLKITDTELRKYTDEELPNWNQSWTECSAMFVDIETSKGVFQIVCYNSHNGYYAHDAVVISRDVNDSEYL